MSKIHSIHVLPKGRDFTGKVEAGNASYQLTFSPRSVKVTDRRLVLTGNVTIKLPNGQTRKADNVTATLLATQGSVNSPPPVPHTLDPSLKPAIGASSDLLPITEATADLGSVGVMYLRLSALEGKPLGIPLDLSNVQLNARLYATSETERDLQWLYSALVQSTLGAARDERAATGYLAEINRIL